MLDLFASILGVATSLLGLSTDLKRADRATTDRAADLFEKVSLCLADVSAEIRLGRTPYGRCGELSAYATDLPDAVRPTIGDSRAELLGAKLASAHDVERFAMSLDQVPDKEPYLRELEEASGKFRALANMLRAQ